jgi:transcriptional regulator with XRE-family HTH domain
MEASTSSPRRLAARRRKPRPAPDAASTLGFFSELGLGIRLFREKAKLTNAALAAASGIGKSQLSKYETGREFPKIDTLAKILDVLGVPPIWFFYVMHQLHREPVAGLQPLDLFAAASAASPLSAQEAAAFSRIFQDLLDLHVAVLEARYSGSQSCVP